MKGDSKRGDELITVKSVLNQKYIEILREIKICASIRVCHYWDMLVDELSMKEEEKVLKEATRLAEKTV